MNKPKKLTLDYSKWRCGGDGERNDNVLGEGDTRLLNDYGYSCCLGQWSSQLGAADEDLLDRGDPSELSFRVPLFLSEMQPYCNSKLANDCIDINDESATTTEEKIEKLSKILAEEGIELEVINKP